MKPRLLSLFCCAGGDTKGYQAAGFHVTGVDIAPQPNYIGDEFIRGDALTILRALAIAADPYGPQPNGFVAVHASPPCQHFTKYGNVIKDIKERYEDLVAPTRELLNKTGLPWVMENVEGSPLVNPVVLCGSMFDLDVKRHRLFETNWPLANHPLPCRHKIWGPNRFPGGNKVRRARDGRSRSKALIRGTVEVGTWSIPLETQKRAMGVDWDITIRELSEAIPPAYTEFIGSQLLARLSLEAAA